MRLKNFAMSKIAFLLLAAFLPSCQKDERKNSSSLEDLKNDLSSAALRYPWVREGYNHEILDAKSKPKDITFEGVKVSFRESVKASIDELGRLELKINQEPLYEKGNKIQGDAIFLIDHFIPEEVFEMIRKSVMEDVDYLENIENEGFDVETAFLIHSEKLTVLSEGTPTVFKRDNSDSYMVIVVDRPTKKEVWLKAENVFLHGIITGDFESNGRNTEIVDLAFSKKVN